jgi:GT2 family glycosyltransferase
VKRKKKPSVNSSHQPEITYIVSAFNRPTMLPVCLWSIKGQSHSDFECIVTDNADHDPTAKTQEAMVKAMGDPRFRYIRTAKKTKVSDCYWSAEWANQHMASGRWLCFPCDDTYLVPEFAQRMLVTAAKENADYVFVKHIVASPEALGGPDTGYAVWSQRLHRTAKTSFIVKRRVFDEVGGFQGKMDRAGTVNADYFFSSQMVKAGKKIAMVSECLVVHN